MKLKLISSVQFVLKFFLAITVLITIKYLSRNVQQGFICGDPSLSLNRKPDTVTNVMLGVWSVSPLLILMLLEMCFNFKVSENIRSCLKRSWNNTAYLFHRYFIDLILMHIIISAVKVFAGAHRPHFFETCQPDKMATCVLGTFVSNYECTNPAENKPNVMDASMSFFSGHAASCVFSCLFICWYLQKRMKCESLFLLPFIQASLICLSVFGSLSRVFDHRHHWWDVLTGVLMGILTTYHTAFVLCKDECSSPEDRPLTVEIIPLSLTTGNKINSSGKF